MAETLKLDWTTAEVTDHKLRLRLTAAAPKQWRDAFDRTAMLLSHGNWQTVLSPRKAAVEVSPVRAGDEERVRQFLEGVVLEANATLVSEQELFAEHDQPDEHESSEEYSDQDTRNQELTDSFRSFARRG